MTKDKPLPCISCTETMLWVYCHSIRDTCDPCGGKSKVETVPVRKPVKLKRKIYSDDGGWAA